MKKTLTRMAVLGGLCVVLSLKPSIADAAEPCTIAAPASSCPYHAHTYQHSPCYSECPAFDQAYLQRLMLRDALQELADSDDSPSIDEPAVDAVVEETVAEEVTVEEVAAEETVAEEVAVEEVAAEVVVAEEVAVEEELTEEEITAVEVADEEEALAQEAADEEMLVEVLMDEELAWEDEEIQAPADIDIEALLEGDVVEYDPQWDCFPFGRDFDGCLDLEPGLVEKLDIDSCLPVIANLDHSAGLDLAMEINEANDGLGDDVVEELFAEELVAEDFEAVVLTEEEATEEEVLLIEIEEGIDPEDAIQAVLDARADAEASGDADELELYELIDLLDACDNLDADLKKVEANLKTLEAPAEIPAFEQEALDLDGVLEVEALELEEESLPQVTSRPLMGKLAAPAFNVLNLSVENLQTTMTVVAGALQQAFTR